MSSSIEKPLYDTSDADFLAEIVADAESRLQAQLTATLAADQRALILAGFLAATLAGLVGGATSLLLAEPREFFLGWVALLASLGIASALGLAIWSARPVDWCFPGTRPDAWLTDIRVGKPRLTRLRERAVDCSRKIADNAEITATNGKHLRASLWVAFVTLSISAIAIIAYFAIGASAGTPPPAV